MLVISGALSSLSPRIVGEGGGASCLAAAVALLMCVWTTSLTSPALEDLAGAYDMSRRVSHPLHRILSIEAINQLGRTGERERQRQTQR